MATLGDDAPWFSVVFKFTLDSDGMLSRCDISEQQDHSARIDQSRCPGKCISKSKDRKEGLSDRHRKR